MLEIEKQRAKNRNQKTKLVNKTQSALQAGVSQREEVQTTKRM